jgi:hypothetical protein
MEQPLDESESQRRWVVMRDQLYVAPEVLHVLVGEMY